MGRLIIEGNSVYEIDEECERKRQKEQEIRKENMEQNRKKRKKNGPKS